MSDTISQPVLPSLHHPSDDGGGTERARGAHKGDLIGGRYLVEGQIGRGGMGRVLRVRHAALGKAFALKIPKSTVATNAEFRRRFHHEAKLASGLVHENICSVVDFGEDERFGLFMVMELLEGVRLDYRLRHDGRMAPRAAYDVLGQVAEAVRFVHGRGIIHGDIKSENILLLRGERRRIVKLLDFGLARLHGGPATGSIEGTPQYLAPERIHGEPAAPASDIYALGILFFELLTGDVPFDGDHREIFARHLTEPVPPPSSRTDRPLDERADLIVARATAKRPEDRHPDVASFLYELRALMAMEGALAPRRQRGDAGARRGARRADGEEALAAELFQNAPLPIGLVDVHGRVRLGNRALLEFLAAPSAEGLMLGDTNLVNLCPTLIDDLRYCATESAPVKRVVRLTAPAGVEVLAAVVLTPSPTPEGAGQVHLVVHPLWRADEPVG